MAYPVQLSIEYPERLSRGLLLLKVFFGWLYAGIPHGIMLTIFGIAVSVVSFIAFWAILFTGKYPRGMYDFVARYMRWSVNVSAYLSLMRDEYPPFSGKQTTYPVTLTVEYPERLSRGLVVLKALFGWLYVGIPHGICLWLYGIAASIVIFIAFWVILFTGKFPKGMFDFVVGFERWSLNVGAYLSLMRDEYPPFSGEQK